MTEQELFVSDIWQDCNWYVKPEPITVDDAVAMFKGFDDDGVEYPDMTPEEYATLWNARCSLTDTPSDATITEQSKGETTMKKLELRDLEDRISSAAIDAYNDSDVSVFEKGNGTLTIMVNRDTITDNGTFQDLESILNPDGDDSTSALILRHWNAIVSYMDDDIRETVHAELAPCTELEFLTRYLELDPDFSDLLSTEFSIRF